MFQPRPRPLPHGGGSVRTGCCTTSPLLPLPLAGATSSLAERFVPLPPCCLAVGLGLGNRACRLRRVLLLPLLQLAGISHAVVEVGGDHGRAVSTRALVTALVAVVRTVDGQVGAALALAGLGGGRELLALRTVRVPARNLPAALASTQVHALIAQAGLGLQVHEVRALDARVGVLTVAALPGRPLARGRGRFGRHARLALAAVGGRVGGESGNHDGLRLPTLRHDRGSDGLRLGGVSHEVEGRRAGELVEDPVGDAGGERAGEGHEALQVQHDVLLGRCVRLTALLLQRMFMMNILRCAVISQILNILRVSQHAPGLGCTTCGHYAHVYGGYSDGNTNNLLAFLSEQFSFFSEADRKKYHKLSFLSRLKVGMKKPPFGGGFLYVLSLG